MARPRNALAAREKNGRAQRQPDRVHAESVFVRQRELAKDGVDPEQWQNSLAGFTLGRLRLRGQANENDPGAISEVQFQAGQAWASIVHRHGQIMGYEVRRNVKSPGFHMIGGTSCIAEPDAEEIGRIRDKFRLCYDALMAVAKDHGWVVPELLYGVCVENWPLERIGRDYGRLRLGLNALALVLK